MAIHPAQPHPPAHGPQRPGEGTLGRAAAIGFAVALGLLRGLGISYTKLMQAGNGAQEALADLIQQIEKLEKEFGGKQVTPDQVKHLMSQLEKAVKAMVADLEKIMHLTDKSHEWNKDFPKQGAKLHKEMEAFLKHLIGEVANAFGDWPNPSDKYFKNFINGKEGSFDWSKVAKDFDEWFFASPQKDIFSGLLSSLNAAASQAQSQFAAYQAQWAYVRKRIENWVQVSEKSVQIQAKTAQFQISKI